MTIFIGADHRGFELKNQILEYLHEKNIRIEDLGAYEHSPLDDAVDFGQKVAQAVLQNPENHLGILICGSGCAAAMAANRLKGVRCGVAMNPHQASHIRENDHANILTLSSDYTPVDEAQKIIDSFLSASPKTDGKYLRRIQKLDK
ncbi:ribose-5-phosphate isomerase [Candidatus Roizmanbacteria bacterium CG_4_10_14_0_2_um_filter_36_35]|uniref:Ribose-5-phosphate isomerase n=4 Tax=Candidatus Roizmaniibacteriota TaxID=1752723 RepID=A0A2M7BVM7_9BACT|nr:MAG: ribose-5-phosphate isomerase [Candidatus Roizmanbacteria bacterium CG11_big_fil_rev_8_21_14_0_20_35_14]PIV10632.1 MAG: ribose-5-phosphate isomerase [Candidatus Roizmanbacteria bacterium CG03_land_8_20_14_0_80_35_26]PIZ67087.1 MAG: ribose-5-phosphate isomerase [Candidatus Roizmanbacteria bacterium CG_4_10_14_0_2_um_filter_36_35]PJC32379.1 MAG: ribose-5-phosphate isomerase [Candidatus Roizmanbacteria bacterium CG_4_9_14_0_2_um_filter_36_12]PJC80199.1 MAG: ribose-5-phosphate isomerase [Can